MAVDPLLRHFQKGQQKLNPELLLSEKSRVQELNLPEANYEFAA